MAGWLGVLAAAGGMAAGGARAASPPVLAGVSVGGLHACAVAAAGTVECWGNNEYGDLGDGRTTASRRPVAVLGLPDAAAVSTGYDHACAVTRTGAVQCW